MFPRAKIFVAAACLLAAAVPSRAAINTPSLVAASTGSLNFSWTGGVSPFIAVLSTSSSFAGYLSSGSVAAAAAGYPALNPDTTYYFMAKSSVDTDAGYRVAAATATWVAAPSGLYTVPAYFLSDSSFTAIASIGWATNSNPEWTSYDVAYNTGGADTVAPYINPAGSIIDISGLKANTTYYFKVRARGISGTYTPYTAEASTATLALRLPGLSDSVHETSATITWTPVNHATIQALDSEGYRVELASNYDMNPLLTFSSTTNSASASAVFGALARNTTYYYRAGALNWPRTPNMSQRRALTTLAAPPQNLARLAVTDGSATLGWTAAAADGAMGYRLEAATGTFSAGEVIHSSATYILSLSTLTLATLDPNTTYYFRAAALNTAYAPNYSAALSSVTLALAPSPGLAYTAAAPQAIVVSFVPLELSPQAFTCEGYRLEASTAVFGSGGAVFSSVTYTQQAGLRSLEVSGLAPNTTYYLRLATLNWDRTPNYTVLASTKTGFPGPLTGVALDGIWSSSAAVAFTPGLAADGHVAEASVYRFFNTIAASSATPSASASRLVIEGLASNTTYYFRAGALYNGATIYTNAEPEYRQTLAETLSGLAFAGVFRASATVSWTPFAGSAKGLLLQVSPTAAFDSILNSSATGNIGLNSLSVGGLSPNTSYYFRAAAVNDEDVPNYDILPATSTLANPPVPQPFGLTPDSITLNWLVNSNPADTRYLVEMDDNSDFSSALPSSTTLISSATFSGLSPNTTYYSRVTAINRLNRSISPVNFPAMATDAYDPAPLAPNGIGPYGLTANWGPNGNDADETWYVATISSNSDFSGTALASTTLGHSASFSGLVSNASYYLQVSALNLSGIPTDPPTPLATALTWPTTAYILPQAQTFSGMMIDGFSVTWAPNENSSHTYYYVQASTRSDFGVINSSRLVRALTCTFSDLMIDTTYWLRVQARGQTGIQSAYEEAGSTRTLLYSLNNALALQENIIALETSYGTISVLLPQGSIGTSTRLRLEPVYSFAAPASAVAELTPTGIGVAITHFPPTLVLGAITITLPYRVSDLPAGTDRSRLVLALYDDARGVWVPLPSVSDTAGNRVIAQTWHLSTFQLMVSNPAPGLAGAKVYPNPYRPNSIADVMHFANLPAYSRIRIYTFLGELVRSLRADVNGMAQWDGLNDSGRTAASGVYIAFIKSGNMNRSVKVALER